MSTQTGPSSPGSPRGSTRIVLAVCTHRRNDSLGRLLDAVRRNAERLPSGVEVGVVVVDDNPDGSARTVCDTYADAFALGLHYRWSGRGNISIARNLGLEAALPISDWLALTDDDCEPDDTWLESYLAAQSATGATALTGPCVLDPGPDAPSWLLEQPFLQVGQFRYEDRRELDLAATNNAFVSAEFLRARPWLRFEEDLGVVGGEDMVFFRTAHSAGLDIRFCRDAVVVGHESPDRATFVNQLRSKYWMGNTEFVTNARMTGSSRPRWLLLSGKRLVEASARPFRRMLAGKPPQFRFSLAMMMRAAGNAAGALGVRTRHH